MERGPLSLVSTREYNLRSYLEKIVAAPVKENETHDRGDPLR
jgi:hypothetical protein